MQMIGLLFLPCGVIALLELQGKYDTTREAKQTANAGTCGVMPSDLI